MMCIDVCILILINSIVLLNNNIINYQVLSIGINSTTSKLKRIEYPKMPYRHSLPLEAQVATELYPWHLVVRKAIRVLVQILCVSSSVVGAIRKSTYKFVP